MKRERPPYQIQQFFFLAILCLLFSCKEVPPFVDFTERKALLVDTSYVVSSLPEAQDRNVLIEDISGMLCDNCVEAAKVAHDLQEQNPGRLFVSTIHPFLFTRYTEPLEGWQDFRTQEGNNIVKELIGEPLGLPAGALNRKHFPQEALVSTLKGTWPGYAAELLSEKTESNLEIEVQADAENHKATLTAKTTFLKEQTSPVYLSVFIIEDHIIGHQRTKTQGIIDNYEHNGILRKAITPYYGVELSSSVDQAGTTFEKGFEIEIDPEWNFQNCSVLVLVNHHNESKKEIIQVALSPLQ